MNQRKQGVMQSRKTCRHCEATPVGCTSVQSIAGRACCEACAGDHDQETTR